MERSELEAAFEDYCTRVAAIRSSGDWSGFADLFTEDCTYREHAFGTFHGREEVRAWVMKTMGAFPGGLMTGFPMAWAVFDPPTGRVICEVRNLMPDPGDGSTLEASNITILTYGHDGLWSSEEDVYNPMLFAQLGVDWARKAAEHGNETPESARFLAKFG